MQYLWIVLVWTSYFFLHSFLADLKVKNFWYQKFPALKKTYRFYYNIFATITLIAATYFHFQQPPHFVFVATIWSKITALVLAITGGWVLRLAFKNYDTQEFMGFRQQQAAEEVHKYLSIQGINAWVRHPIYLGALLVFAGVFVYQPTFANLALLGVVILYIFVGVYLEEQKLLKVFGQSYKDYKKKVRMLIPRIL
ncbi:MAG TPA: hypothetical protein DCS93_42235 [Microscillaceae bacterium]|nr:hypothetical protein [Microscillaceae bacterium]